MQSYAEWGSDFTFTGKVMLPHHRIRLNDQKAVQINLVVKISHKCKHIAPTPHASHADIPTVCVFTNEINSLPVLAMHK